MVLRARCWVLGAVLGAGCAVLGADAVPGAQPPATLSLVRAATMGRSDAPVVMIEYSDFHCPFCRKYTVLAAP